MPSAVFSGSAPDAAAHGRFLSFPGSYLPASKDTGLWLSRKNEEEVRYH